MPRKSDKPMVLAAPRRPRYSRSARNKSAGMVRAAAPYKSLRGRGDYTYDKPGPWGKAGRWIGSALGSHFAGAGGGKLGEKLGSYLHYIGKIFGSGDYVTSAQQVKHNTLVNSSQIPQFVDGKHATRIQHREYLGDIYSGSLTNGASVFQRSDFPINPGMLQTFPWLSNVCGPNWQQHRINGMVFEYRSGSADALNSTNTALGYVVMATDYDSADAVFVDKQSMENTEFAVSCKPACSMIHAIECAKRQTPINEQYVRYAAPPANADIRLYDLGRFSIATVGMQAANVNLGELWVSYDIELLKPIQNPPLIDSEYAYYNLSTTTATLNSHPVTLNADTSNNFDNIGLSIDATANTVTFPPTMRPHTTLLVQHYVLGASTAGVVAPLAAGTQSWIGGAQHIVPATATTSTQSYSEIFVVYDGLGSLNSPPIITFGPMTAPGTITAAFLQVMQVNWNVLQL